MQNAGVRRALWSALAVGSAAALAAGSLVVAASPGWSAPQQHAQTFLYTGEAESWTVPEGVNAIEVELRGGQGGNGGRDAAPSPEVSSYRGLVTGTIDVEPGQRLTVAVGAGGADGSGRVNMQAAPVPVAPGGANPLAGYAGGAGGQVGSVGSSGQGGAGGAASVLRMDGVDVVAGGGGGNGGSGQYTPTIGRTSDANFVPRADASATNGQDGLQPSGGNNDGGGSGGGGGGAQGGARGTVEFGAGTSTEWFGYGGSVGQNATAGIPTLSAGYEHRAETAQPGSIVIRWVTGTAAAPAAPQGVAGTGEVEVYWRAPAQIGEGPVVDYLVEHSSDGGANWSAPRSVGSAATELTVGGLENGTGYVFRVAAVTPAGTGAFSPPSPELTPDTAPPEDGALRLAFTAPASGATPSGYQYRVDGGPWVPATVADASVTVTGLRNGAEASIELRATSGRGAGAPSAPATGTPLAAPGAPTITNAAVAPGSASVAFAPGFDGGSAITGYEYRLDGGPWESVPSGSGPLELAGLADGSAHEVRIRAVNAAGPGAASEAAEFATPGVPGALADPAATGGDGVIEVGFRPGPNGGSPITSVEFSLDGGASWAAVPPSSPLIVRDLPNGVEQRVLLRAVNAVGAGPESSVAATPATVPGSPAIDSVRDNGLGGLELVFRAPGDDGGSAILDTEYSSDGGVTWRSAGGNGSPLVITVGSDGSALDPGTVYPITLRSVNGVGAGPASGGHDTRGPVPAQPAGAPRIDAVDSRPGALAVRFVPGPNGGAAVTGYEYSLDGDTWRPTGTLAGAFVIDGLRNGTGYPVRVRAVTASGPGSASEPVTGTPAGVPAAPTLTSVQRGDGRLTLEVAPGDDGGSPLTGYEYSADGGASWHAAGSADGGVVVDGLANGRSATVQLRAVNAVGAGDASNALTAIPAGAPAAPRLTLTPGDTIVAVSASFASDGGAPLTRVEYSLDGGTSWIDTGSLSGGFLLGGRENGAPVEVLLRGVNAIGAGDAATGTATPLTVPGAPVAVSATGNSSSIEARWEAPASDGGSPITGYEARAYTDPSSSTPVASCVSADASGCTIQGLTNGTGYFVAVVAVNAAGAGPESERRPSATPLQRPAAPAITAVTELDQRLTLSFAAGAEGDRPILRYEASIDGGRSWAPFAAASPGTLSGLSNGTAYEVRIRAVSEAGPGAASAPRSGIPYGYPLAPAGVAATAGDGSVAVSWDPADLNGRELGQYEVSLFDAPVGGNRVGSPHATTGTALTVTGLVNGRDYYVSLQSYGVRGADGKYSERSEPRLLVTPGQPGVAPVFGPVHAGTDGYTVTIANYLPEASYTLDASGLPEGARAGRTGDTIVVSGLAPGVGAPIGVTVTRSGYTPASASTTGTALLEGIAPSFGSPTHTSDGFRVTIENYDPGTEYTLQPAGTAHASLDAQGVITVTGLAPGETGRVAVQAAKPGSTPASATAQGQALSPAIVPAFAPLERTPDGFRVRLSNYDPVYAWTVESSGGRVLFDETGLITVVGLAPGASATVSVSTARSGYATGGAEQEGAALEAGRAPQLGEPRRTPDGYVVRIADYDPDADYALDASALPEGASAVRDGDTITVTGLAPGTEAGLGVTVSRPGAVEARAELAGTALDAGVAPELGAVTRTADGFVFDITDFDPHAEYAVDAPEGVTVRMDGGTVIVSGLEPGQLAELRVRVQRGGATAAATAIAGAAQLAGTAPRLSEPRSVRGGFEVLILDFDPRLDYTVAVSHGEAQRDGDRIVVSGLRPGESAELTVEAASADTTASSSAVVGSAAPAAPDPGSGDPGSGDPGSGDPEEPAPGGSAGGASGAEGSGIGGSAADDSRGLAATGAAGILPLAGFAALLLIAGAALLRRRA
ncbi:fibronectin type III domain-containing protein [Leucobacter massiliensis]|uniref:fibronectin type III domain-containing protein n=1 Tax=Leucobacter massiliensis TaxID=1686285 RepID=UPI0011B1F872|nr:fibronectin type III domain-containing protein [Leucobacter massiliensis]